MHCQDTIWHFREICLIFHIRIQCSSSVSYYGMIIEKISHCAMEGDDEIGWWCCNANLAKDDMSPHIMMALPTPFIAYIMTTKTRRRTCFIYGRVSHKSAKEQCLGHKVNRRIQYYSVGSVCLCFLLCMSSHFFKCEPIVRFVYFVMLGNGCSLFTI